MVLFAPGPSLSSGNEMDLFQTKSHNMPLFRWGDLSKASAVLFSMLDLHIRVDLRGSQLPCAPGVDSAAHVYSNWGQMLMDCKSKQVFPSHEQFISGSLLEQQKAGESMTRLR